MSSHHPFAQSAQLKRCTEALATRPASLLTSSFTLTRMACMIRTVRMRINLEHAESHPSIANFVLFVGV
jgi:hypothetical protein